MEGAGSATPQIEEGEQGAGLHGRASREGCGCHPAGQAQGRQLPAKNKFEHYLQCVRGDLPLGGWPPTWGTVRCAMRVTVPA